MKDDSPARVLEWLTAHVARSDGKEPSVSSDVAAILAESPSPAESLLLRFAELGNHDGVSESLVSGISVEARLRTGETPLILAAMNGHRRIVDTLVASGTDVNAWSPRSGTALSRASDNGYEDIVATVLHHGAAVDRALASTRGTGGDARR